MTSFGVPHHAEHVRCNEDAENSKDNREKNVITSVVLTVRLTFHPPLRHNTER